MQVRSAWNLGQVLATPGALAALEEAQQTASEFLDRHRAGDWGSVCPEDALANDQSLVDGSRLLSVYLLSTGVKMWIITEAADERGQRAATTLLLPEDY